MPKRSRPYEVGLNERLRDPDYAVSYLNAMWEDSVEGFLLALRQVASAREGMAELAGNAGLNRENLYRMLSEEGNPRLNSFASVLGALGIKPKFELVDRETAGVRRS